MNALFPNVVVAIAIIATVFCSGFVSSQRNTVPFYRYYNSGNGDHFYTSNWSELEDGKDGYVYEGVQCLLPIEGTIDGTIPLHRYFNSRNGDHFYTTNWNELRGGQGDYSYQGVAGYVFSDERHDRTPLYRYYNGENGDHLYTTSSSEYSGEYEGIAGYVYINDGR